MKAVSHGLLYDTDTATLLFSHRYQNDWAHFETCDCWYRTPSGRYFYVSTTLAPEGRFAKWMSGRYEDVKQLFAQTEMQVAEAAMKIGIDPVSKGLKRFENA